MEAGFILIYAIIVLRVPLWCSLVFSWLHCFQEVAGDLTGYFDQLRYESGRQAPITLRMDHVVAGLLFGPGLAASLTVLASIGYADMQDEPQSGTLASIALAALCGARLGDAALSHIGLAFVRMPNPGLSTAACYVIEGCMLLLYVQWGVAEAISALVAAGGFAAVNPVIGLVGLELRDNIARRTEGMP